MDASESPVAALAGSGLSEAPKSTVLALIWRMPPPEPMASLPWFHNVLLIEKVKDPAERIWYAQKAIEHGWSRSILDHQIDSGLHRRQGKALTNFEPDLRSVLKKGGFLTRDSRVVERKKYGRAKARKSFQFSKR